MLLLKDGDETLLPSKSILIQSGSLILIAEILGSKSSEILYRKVIKEFKIGDKIPRMNINTNTLLYIRALSDLRIINYEFETESQLTICEELIISSLIESHQYLYELKARNTQNMHILAQNISPNMQF